MSDKIDESILDNDEQNAAAPLPLWKKILLGLAFGLAMVGVVLYVVILNQPEPVATEMQAHSAGETTYLSQNGVPQTGEQASPSFLTAITMGDWSTLLMKLGFSFMIGFALGYALSNILKVVLLVVGLIALLLFGLQYAGLIDVNWHNFEPYYDSFIAWLQPHIGSFKDFVTSNLPSSTLAAAGLFVGFRKF